MEGKTNFDSVQHEDRWCRSKRVRLSNMQDRISRRQFYVETCADIISVLTLRQWEVFKQSWA